MQGSLRRGNNFGVCISIKEPSKTLGPWTVIQARKCQPIWPGQSSIHFAAAFLSELLRLFFQARRVVRIALETRPQRRKLRGQPRF
ncbi:hypothetical protein SKAU_G00082840 [Synaphobranchus kaupii]|uniref:Uncharacterized protein n=1 Tax=Synaphobranchus kaupii TaxID=118154 RepID=A0A9Q1FW23_SYNKA|nr:hypothetical protein SKAU_G00082840 [Synaphobranchus kaupii]